MAVNSLMIPSKECACIRLFTISLCILKMLQKLVYILSAMISDYNALVICNHGPPAPGNSGDFDFWSSKSPLKAPPCGEYSLINPLLFSPAACYQFIKGPFAYVKQTLCISPTLPW